MKYLVIDLEENGSVFDYTHKSDANNKGLMFNALLRYAATDGAEVPQENENIFNLWNEFVKGVYLIDKKAEEQEQETVKDHVPLVYKNFKPTIAEQVEELKYNFSRSFKQIYKNRNEK